MSTEYRDDEAFARSLDAQDPLRPVRDRFHIPAVLDDEGRPTERETVYLCGNSLGLQPKGVGAAVERELEDWRRLAVEAHLKGRCPWFSYHEVFRETGARLVGARPGEVVMMNSLTVNLHLMMATFYRPTVRRYRIVVEDAVFPSDGYAVASQAAWHGLDPGEAVVRLRPREGERTLRTEDVVGFIEQEGESVALVMLGGVNYLTGQWFDMERITAAGKSAGCVVGWDLAHAAGNVPVRLHDWGVDFAVWCSYKYLNAGPGAVAGCFVHDHHGSDTALPRLAGWWGNDPETRFRMEPGFVPRPGADGWQVSNPPILSMAPLRVSLEIFDEVGMEALRRKSERLTGYMEYLLDRIGSGRVEVVTPRDRSERGCQLSLEVRGDARGLHESLRGAGVVCDVREPNVIRAAPVPLYNTFHDVWRFVDTLRRFVAV